MLRSKRKGRQYMAIRANIDKAYDRMEWNLIITTLKCFGFHERFIRRISQCISTVSYSILLNGSPTRFFKPTRGLCQGDPLSPLLFIIGSKVFSRMLIREEQANHLHGIQLDRGVPAITHLLFADDLLIFRRASREEAGIILECLQRYGNWSGQRLHPWKSSVSFRQNVRHDNNLAICSILNLPWKESVDKHLGIPMVLGRNKHRQFSSICDRVKHV